MNVILCGYNWIGCKALQILIDSGYNIFVYTHPSPYFINDLEDFCKKRNINYSLSKIEITNLPFIPDLMISIYYRFKISKDIIDICKNRIFNLHPSLLPKYRGCSSLTWAMVNGEKNTGFTYHYIEEDLDTGNIILQKKVEIEEFDTQITLYHRIMFDAIRDLKQVIHLVCNGFKGFPQANLTKNEYYKRGCPYNGIINETWDNETSERFIRAMIYPPLPAAKFNGKEIYRISDITKQ